MPKYTKDRGKEDMRMPMSRWLTFKNYVSDHE